VGWRPFRGIDLDLRAFYKRIFRMPTFNDLYYTFIGNINLKPEFTTQYNAGASWSENFGRVSLGAQADVYYNEVENKIVAVPGDNQFRWTMLNFGLVKITGVDASLRTGLHLGKFEAHALLSYAFQNARDFTDPESDHHGDRIPYIPLHSGSVTAGASLRGWELNYSFIYTGERYEQAANTLENYVRPWYTHDMSLARNFKLRGAGMRVAAGVNNIFNQAYEVVQCYPMPGINFKLTVSVTI
jgi:outer membrane receptor protein involved in Fe transport